MEKQNRTAENNAALDAALAARKKQDASSVLPAQERREIPARR